MKKILSVEERGLPNAENENNFAVNFEGNLHRIGLAECNRRNLFDDEK